LFRPREAAIKVEREELYIINEEKEGSEVMRAEDGLTGFKRQHTKRHLFSEGRSGQGTPNQMENTLVHHYEDEEEEGTSTLRKERADIV